MTYPRRAIVASWLSHLLLHEADEISYRWPPASEEEQADARAYAAMSDTAWRRARRAAGVAANSEESEALWRAALDEWTPEVA